MENQEDRIRKNVRNSAYLTSSAFFIGAVLMLLANYYMHNIWFIIISVLFFIGSIFSYFLISRLEKVFIKSEKENDVRHE